MKRPLLISVLLFLAFSCYYFQFQKKIPISYWDEALWVGRSYSFEYYIKGDFGNPFWKSFVSYDQPKLAEFAYGAWLHPLYLKNGSVSYEQYLKNNGFNSIKSVTLHPDDDGFEKDYVVKYGREILKPISIIKYARVLNVVLLSMAVVTAYLLVSGFLNLPLSILFVFFYGFNPLLLNTGLKAHSEALFLLTFNMALLFMKYYFTKLHKFPYLALFSLFSGLCMATKLNGLMLLIIFFLVNFIVYFGDKKNKLRRMLLSIIPAVFGFIVFIVLNPFTYISPLKNTIYLFNWRMAVASGFQSTQSSNFALPSFVSRIKQIFENFYFSQDTINFNGVALVKNIGGILFVFFILGIIYMVRQSNKKNIFAIIAICSFVVIIEMMGEYLYLNWNRYYVHLVLFFVLFQVVGLRFLFQKIKQIIYLWIF